MKKFCKVTIVVCVIAVILWLIYITRSMLQQFFGNYRDVFAGIGYSLIGVGLIFTWIQLNAAKKRARASISYQIHKDGREIRNLINNKTKEAIESPLSNEVECDKKVEEKIREMLMYFSSVFHQYEFGNIDESEWKLLKEQFFIFLKYKRVEKYWKDNITDNHSWHEGLRKLGDDFINEKQRRKT